MPTSLVLPHEPLTPSTRADLSDLGLSRCTLTAALVSGQVLQPMTGVYLDARTADDSAVRARAVSLAVGQDAVVTRGLAAWLHGSDPRAPHERDRPLPLECLAPPGGRVPDRKGLVTHLDRLPAGDVCSLDGVLVTTVARTVLDTSRSLAPHTGLAVADAVAHAGLVVPELLVVRYDDRPPRQRWMARGERCLRLCEKDTESYGESWTRLRIVDAGFPRPRPQIWAPEERPGAYRLDMGGRRRRRSSSSTDRRTTPARRRDPRRGPPDRAAGALRLDGLGRAQGRRPRP